MLECHPLAPPCFPPHGGRQAPGPIPGDRFSGLSPWPFAALALWNDDAKSMGKGGNMDRYFECRNCGQVVQGWHATFEWYDRPCEHRDGHDWVEIDREAESQSKDD